MSDQKTAAEIDSTATEWLVKAERGLTRDEQIELDEWLNDSSRHLGAFVRAQAAWIHAERATALGAMPEPIVEEPLSGNADPDANALDTIAGKRRLLSRRSLIAGGGALAASIAGVGFLAFDRSRTIESNVGEIRHLALAGGTSLTLDTDTRVDILEGGSDRQLKLVYGKLFLDVMTGSSPLVIDGGGFVLEMMQGAFAVQSLANAPFVALVTKGDLSVSQGGRFFDGKRKLRIGKNQLLTVPENAYLMPNQVNGSDRDQEDQLLAWRDGMLAFGGETLATAARAFDRYGQTRILVTDPQLSAQKITGLFNANDPKGFANAIAASFGALVTEQADNVIISKK